MTTPEGKVKDKIKKHLIKRGIWFWSHSDRYQAGYPDMEVIHNGRTIRFEVKREHGGRVEPIQALVISQIRKAGGEAYVVTSVDEVKKIIENNA